MMKFSIDILIYIHYDQSMENLIFTNKFVRGRKAVREH
jgi:hypothetical protein